MVHKVCVAVSGSLPLVAAPKNPYVTVIVDLGEAELKEALNRG